MKKIILMCFILISFSAVKAQCDYVITQENCKINIKCNNQLIRQLNAKEVLVWQKGGYYIYLSDGITSWSQPMFNIDNYDTVSTLIDSVTVWQVLCGGTGSIFLDNQQISISGDTVYLERGGFAVLPESSGGGTDDQQLSKSNDTIYLEDGGFVVVPSLHQGNGIKIENDTISFADSLLENTFIDTKLFGLDIGRTGSSIFSGVSSGYNEILSTIFETDVYFEGTYHVDTNSFIITMIGSNIREGDTLNGIEILDFSSGSFAYKISKSNTENNLDIGFNDLESGKLSSFKLGEDVIDITKKNAAGTTTSGASFGDLYGIRRDTFVHFIIPETGAAKFRNHTLQDKDGTLAHTSDLSSYGEEYVDGITTTSIVLPETPLTGSVFVFKNRDILYPTTEYVVSGNTITLAVSAIISDIFYIKYQY